MSEARDVIARALASVGAFDSEGEATVVDMALTAAGYRILGPDEVDPVTVERIAEFAKSEFQRNFESPVGWRDQFADAIRALGRKA